MRRVPLTFYYGSGSPYAWRVWLAIEYKHIAAELRTMSFAAGDLKTPEYAAINPRRRVPAIVDDGFALYESVAILEYLDEIKPEPPLLPKDAPGRARVRGLAQIIACDTHPMIVPRIRNYLEKELKIDEPARNRWAQNWIVEGLKAVESHLGNEPETGRYCHGDTPTLADICVVSQVFGVRYVTTLFGFVFFGHQVGSFLGVWLGGVVFEATGSYDVIWIGAMILGVLAAALHWPIDDRAIGRPTAREAVA